MIAVFQQTILYRVVALADGCTLMWNRRNQLVSIICARALMETNALLYDFERRLAAFCEAGDLGVIEVLAVKTLMSTKLKHLLKQHPIGEATNVLTFIDRLEKEIEDTRDTYDDLSEMCHPNSHGHFLMFAQINTNHGGVLRN
jgi:hypothetical protein